MEETQTRGATACPVISVRISIPCFRGREQHFPEVIIVVSFTRFHWILPKKCLEFFISFMILVFHYRHYFFV